MNVSDFDYELPDELIAQRPLADRSASRMLVLDPVSQQFEERTFRSCVDFIQPDDLIVYNTTRVTAVRLYGSRPSGGKVEALVMSEESPGVYEALMKPAKKMRVGETVSFGDGLDALVVEVREEGLRLIEFSEVEGLQERLSQQGVAPLPPYIHEDLKDVERYQTVYANLGGSCAAPTAGLHFTNDVIEQIKEKGADFAEVSLDVGLDTFRPMSAETTEGHLMHGETCRVSQQTADKVRSCKGRVIAVGTTTARTLEAFSTGRREIDPGQKTTKVFITPGYEFKTVDAMFTNFHMPRTTMMLMISALAGRELIMDSYKFAVQCKFRMLSFGDSMLILPDSLPG